MQHQEALNSLRAAVPTKQRLRDYRGAALHRLRPVTPPPSTYLIRTPSG